MKGEEGCKEIDRSNIPETPAQKPSELEHFMTVPI